ncbi:ribbon-helix-helix domain-containing protein [Devosia sp.]|uniref:ribbon-helix-helix domain-containing protein n=1 Tax=Devosia sp. TaxID=1871048 RepID=UPI002F1B7858
MNDSASSADLIPVHAPRPHDGLIEAAAPQFRTVSTQHGRTGIRIERVFWDGLDRLSRGQGRKRRELVGEIIALARAADMPVASALRCYVAAAQRSELDRLQQLAGTVQAVRLLQAGPVPSFALNRHKRLLRANPEFVHYLRRLFAQPTVSVSPEVAQLSLERPLGQLFDELADDGTATRCLVTIRVGDQLRRATCRIVAAPPFPAQALVGFVLSELPK